MPDRSLPLLEYDPIPDAILQPGRFIPPLGGPERCVLCFFQEVIEALVRQQEVRQIARLKSEMGVNPVYQLGEGEEAVMLLHPGVGAPLAAGFLEEAIALGARKVIACGGAGVLRGDIGMGHLVIPSAAVRDEGTSFHYLPPAREVAADPRGVEAIERVLQRRGMAYLVGKTWTTDGLYRETRERVARRVAEGCLTVEMEAAAFFAVGHFRGVTVGQVLYGGDDLSGEVWDSRGWAYSSNRETVFRLAVEAVQEL